MLAGAKLVTTPAIIVDPRGQSALTGTFEDHFITDLTHLIYGGCLISSEQIEKPYCVC